MVEFILTGRLLALDVTRTNLGFIYEKNIKHFLLNSMGVKVCNVIKGYKKKYF